ncbi:hypothetical protein H312_00358 [Anncaliia algerae PRA339]|uniref:Very-long-chain (3R)-3-hydroxyacyl-CoA dehydratase n=1 Tax=Anncaliia algerae PRA339 TaxID=1288291 RepID=A0A059F551_9MICR|nr:hypothetical protein H312_00358 [Anncaliia algerae PRA339]
MKWHFQPLMSLVKYQLFFNFLGVNVILFGFICAILYRVYGDIKFLRWVAYTQSFFVFEIINIMIGATRSTYLATIIQVTSRVYISWVVAYYHNLNNIYLTIMLIVWNISDMIRYLFYIFRGKLLKKLRYNAFIILYPVGIGLEIFLTNMVYLKHKGHAAWFYATIMILYIPLFPFLYYHMIKQRKRSSAIFEMNKKKK